MKQKYLVTIDIPDDDTPARVREYMRDAITSWSGQFHPEDPLFGWFHASKHITIRFVSKDTR